MTDYYFFKLYVTYFISYYVYFCKTKIGHKIQCLELNTQ